MLTLKEKLIEELGDHDPSQIYRINLDNSFTTDIDGLLDDFTNLIYLSLSNVGLTKLDNFPYLPNLSKLNLNGNHICDQLDILVEYCPSLSALCLTNNGFTDIKQLKELSKLQCLEYLEAYANNNFDDYDHQTIFDMLPYLKYLDEYEYMDEEEFANVSDVEAYYNQTGRKIFYVSNSSNDNTSITADVFSIGSITGLDIPLGWTDYPALEEPLVSDCNSGELYHLNLYAHNYRLWLNSLTRQDVPFVLRNQWEITDEDIEEEPQQHILDLEHNNSPSNDNIPPISGSKYAPGYAYNTFNPDSQSCSYNSASSLASFSSGSSQDCSDNASSDISFAHSIGDDSSDTWRSFLTD